MFLNGVGAVGERIVSSIWELVVMARLSECSPSYLRKIYMRGLECEDPCALAVRDYHAVGVYGNWQSYVYRNFRLPSGFIYFSFKGAFASLDVSSSGGEVRDFLWERMWQELVARRVRRSGRGKPVCWLGEFPKRCVEFAGLSSSDVERVRVFYCGYLAYLVWGVVSEFVVFRKLSELAPDDLPVVWGSDEDEHRDVDLYVGGVPVSVKCFDAWSPSTVYRYRDAGKIAPKLYVNERLWFMNELGHPVGDRDDLFEFVRQCQY